MSKTYKSKNLKFKNVAYGIATVAISCLIGMTAACSDSSDDDDDEKVTTKQDTQILKNGNFEFFDDNDGYYYISSPDNWTGSSNGSSSDSISGVIKTDYDSWKAFTDPDLPTILDDNDDLDDDDDDKIDYNGVLQDDLPYKDTHAATKSDAEADNGDLDYIDNPYTHTYSWDSTGKLIDASGNEVTTYKDDDGKYYLDEALTKPVETSVLMIHNYDEDNNYGTEYYFSSSTELTLEANTAAKISVWVKTVELTFAGSTGDRTKVTDSMGAYIKVDQTVGGNSLDSFYIKNINTSGVTENNGWVQYNVYVQACDYAETTLTLTLGLGENSRYLVEGYAFFDDATFTKYRDADAMKEANGGETAFDELVSETTCGLLSEADDKKYRTDKVTVWTENGKKEYNYYKDNYDFYINLNLADVAITTPDSGKITFDSSSLAMGLTVDDDNYTTSKVAANVKGDASTISTNTSAYIPYNLNSGKKTDGDVLANVTITSAGITNGSSIFGDYNTRLSESLKNAVNLPGAADSQNAFVMLSTEGAAYQANITNSLFTVDANSYKVVSFWIKTSDMKGDTAATITVKDTSDKDNTSSFTVDTTTISQTDISVGSSSVTNDDNTYKDIYDGWVQCFVLVSNTLDDDSRTFEITVNFGATTIKDTTDSSYRPGWVAITNMTVIEVDETSFGYISSDTSATLSFSEEETSTDTAFDTEYGDYEDISNKIVRPSNYNGYNATSAAVTVGGQTPSTDEAGKALQDAINQKNKHELAGLICKDGILNYNLGSAITALNGITDKDSAWNILTQGTNESVNYTVQPLLIVNTLRTLAETNAIYSYGYVGESQSLSEDSYTAISVKVKVSAGAIAKVYLIDPDTKDVLNFNLPTYTFWYDDDGNVLKDEPDEDADTATQKANIAYKLDSTGLYTDADGKYYANIYNLKREYYNEQATYYDADGNDYIYEDLKDGVIYYADAAATKYAPHYLVTDDGDRVYSYIEGLNGNATYYYMVEDVVSTDYVVHGFDTNVAKLRYEGVTDENSKYVFTIDATTEEGKALYADKWVTVNFYVHTGNQEKTYRLELWSGDRNVLKADELGVTENSYVLFDYSLADLDEDTYNDLVSYYTDGIIEDYRANLNGEYASNDKAINYYENLAGTNKSTKYNYLAKYYTYTLYDSTNYLPFNEDTAEDTETGYSYTYSDYAESLAYLRVEDSEATTPSMSMFIDYSTCSQEITIGTAEDVTDDDDDDDDTTSETNVWLLVSSICLVVALIVAILAILIKDLLKKRKTRKTAGKNNYNYNKNKRYVKKYTKANGAVATDKAVTDTTATSEAKATPVENAPVEETPADNTPADNTPVDNATEVSAPVEETPADNVPAEDTTPSEASDSNASETPDNGDSDKN
jgi:hypothetical protein